ncbi:MAG: hypothetical protein ACK4JB_19325 [Reyranella sp.]
MSEFHGAFIKNADKITARKSIVICGPARGGTSFAASIFVRLGIPFTRGPRDKISGRHEHLRLKEAFLANDPGGIQRISEEFSSMYPVWGWKLPAIQRRLEATAALVPNPHFVMIFKEPLSVAARRSDLKERDVLKVLPRIVATYHRLAGLAAETKHPMLLISYDRAIANMPEFLTEVARFAGVPSFDEGAVIAGIREDGKRYFRQAQ